MDCHWASATGMEFKRYIGSDSKIKNAKTEWEATLPRWSDVNAPAKEAKREKTGDELIDEFFSGMTASAE